MCRRELWSWAEKRRWQEYIDRARHQRQNLLDKEGQTDPRMSRLMRRLEHEVLLLRMVKPLCRGVDGMKWSVTFGLPLTNASII